MLFAPLALLVYAIVSRLWTKRKYREGWRQKLGSVPVRASDRPCVWVHAVSVGEAITAAPLVEALRARWPDWDIDVSVSTPTGHEVASRRLRDVAEVIYAPMDFGPIVARSLRRRRPNAIVLVELELWPGFLLGAALRDVPVFVANGRLTERSASRYVQAGFAARRLFALVSGYAVQSSEYAERFGRLVPEASLAVLGNLKHDRSLAPGAEVSAREVRARLGWDQDELVVVAGSTHPGEESVFCAALERWASTSQNVRLVLVPRHVERLESGDSEIASWGARRPLRRWSEVRAGDDGGLGEAVLVVDTLGELETFYCLADVAFVGGSLIEHGGHNLFEAARTGVAVLFGPHYGNFAEEAEHLLEAGGALCVRDADQLEVEIGRLLTDGKRRQELSERGRSTTVILRGAVERHIEWLEGQLGFPEHG